MCMCVCMSVDVRTCMCVCVHTCGMHACVHVLLWPQNELSIAFVHFLYYIYDFI